MQERITLTGKIEFDVEDMTKKHINQSSWKKMAMVMLSGDICQYYAWFISKRYNLTLNKPLRGAHISFINDSLRDMTQNGERTLEEAQNAWDTTKAKWNGKTLNIVLDLSPRTDDISWWLNIPHDERHELQSIRTEIGLGKPYYGMHMSIGYANERWVNHSEYIHTCIKSGLII